MSAPHRLGRHVTTIAGKALGRHGLAFGALITDWPSIVGERLASQTSPAKLQFPQGKREEATLTIAVSGAAAPLVMHEEPQLLQRINGFFGYRAVSRIKMVQAGPPSKPPRRAPAPRRLGPAEEKALLESTATVPDEELKAALEKLGRAVVGSKPK
ncbi:MAG TPA: DciA family protein [Azospirillaceae bacterium]|nr:DciA family protein [Azospirillaceae bacterium]